MTDSTEAEMERVTLEIHDAAQAALARRRNTTPERPEKIIAAGIAVTWWYASKLPVAEHDAQADKTAAEIIAALKRAGFTFRRRKTS